MNFVDRGCQASVKSFPRYSLTEAPAAATPAEARGSNGADGTRDLWTLPRKITPPGARPRGGGARPAGRWSRGPAHVARARPPGRTRRPSGRARSPAPTPRGDHHPVPGVKRHASPGVIRNPGPAVSSVLPPPAGDERHEVGADLTSRGRPQTSVFSTIEPRPNCAQSSHQRGRRRHALAGWIAAEIAHSIWASGAGAVSEIARPVVRFRRPDDTAYILRRDPGRETEEDPADPRRGTQSHDSQTSSDVLPRKGRRFKLVIILPRSPSMTILQYPGDLATEGQLT